MVFGFPSPFSNEHAKIYILSKQTEKNQKKIQTIINICFFTIFAARILH